MRQSNDLCAELLGFAVWRHKADRDYYDLQGRHLRSLGAAAGFSPSTSTKTVTDPSIERIEYITGSSLDTAVLARVRKEAAGNETVLVILDSDHHSDHVLTELRGYSEIVTPGSYLIVEDANINGHPVRAEYGPGPREAVDIFLADTPDFVPDTGCEKFLLTWNAGGYLRRVGPPAGGYGALPRAHERLVACDPDSAASAD